MYRSCTRWDRTGPVLASVGLKDQLKLIVGSFYWPLGNLMQAIDDFEKIDFSDMVHKLKKNPNYTVIFDSDFKAGDIDWDSNTVHEKYQTNKLMSKVG